MNHMEKATELGYKAFLKEEVPVGAVITLNNKIISKAYNKREKNQRSTHHAEILAIQKACKKLKSWRLDNCDIYITLEPCPMCAGAIMNARIKNVYFGATDKKNGAVVSAAQLFDMNFTHKPLYEGGIMGDECAQILSDFFKDLRKKKAGEEK